MSTLLNKFDDNIKKEHKDIYEILKRKNLLLLYIKKKITTARWYHFLSSLLILCSFNVIFSFNYESIPILKYFNFIKINNNYIERVLHEYTLYIGTFISITLIATTFLFNFLKEIMDTNIKLIVRYVNYESVAYYGFSLVICLLLQKLLSLTLSISALKNLLVLDFYLVIIFILLLIRLYARVFEIIKPTKLKEIYVNDTRKIFALNIFQELYKIKSEKIFKDTLIKNNFSEISNFNYFFGDEKDENINYLFNRRKGFYLKDVNFKKLLRRTKKFKIKKFVPVHFEQKFNEQNDYLLLGFENDNEKFRENKFWSLFKISTKNIHEYLILKSYKFTKKNTDKSIATEQMNEKLEFIFDELNDSVYKRNHKGLKKVLNDFDAILDLYTENFE